MEIKPIAFIQNDFTDKFAIPRQSGLTDIKSKIVFEDEYSDANALRGLEDFSHIWLIWGFSKNIREKHSLTVRPPRLGGNTRVGVFASRSPFRPNNLGLSCVKLVEIKNGEIIVSGADLMNGTPIYDIKPYINYSDSVPEAKSGYVDTVEFPELEVEIKASLLNGISEEKRNTLIEILKKDPRPAYQREENRDYGFTFAGYEIKFSVKDGILKVKDITNEQ
ncbi:MAG: tRNA (N6-threonylcarbamoyladenosine(37)-N6)-methyltransferase TrmO [Eubacterium sp.]|nr:tRNA (N6-threonylcarbamoyladenosine(37)-N6)-methyltransferase TrmO [Eubacterium sp.]